MNSNDPCVSAAGGGNPPKSCDAAIDVELLSSGAVCVEFGQNDKNDPQNRNALFFFMPDRDGNISFRVPFGLATPVGEVTSRKLT